MATIRVPHAGSTVCQVWVLCQRCGRVLPDPRVELDAAFNLTVTVDPCGCVAEPEAHKVAQEGCCEYCGVRDFELHMLNCPALNRLGRGVA
jgi:hypothetical protein